MTDDHAAAARRWAEALGRRYAAERAHFDGFLDAVRDLAQRVPALALEFAPPGELAFAFAGARCRLRFVFQEHAPGSVISLEPADGAGPFGESALLDAAGTVRGLKGGDRALPRDAEAVFLLLLRGPRG